MIAVLNGTLEAVYGAFGVPVADVETAFGTFKTKGGDPPTNVRRVRALTLMCEKSGDVFVLSDYDPGEDGPRTDIHPSNLGYRKTAAAHNELIDDLSLLD